MKTFTVREAQSMLPVLESLLRRAIDARELTSQLDEGNKQLAEQIYLNGGMWVDIRAAAERWQQRERLLQLGKDAVAEIESIGVVVKDLESGQLDFPTRRGGQVVLLCWQLGEPRIAYWHSQQEGYDGRKPLGEQDQDA